jgi:hypothetical protein
MRGRCGSRRDERYYGDYERGGMTVVEWGRSFEAVE